MLVFYYVGFAGVVVGLVCLAIGFAYKNRGE